jgi:hypothetical protein
MNRVDFEAWLDYMIRTAKELKQMAVVVFDLDMTVIDSSHRHASKPDGSIDLAHWFENCHRAADDTLLPLSRAVRRLYDAGHHIVLCTSRCMQDADFAWIEAHREELPHHILFWRHGQFVTPDDELNYPISYHGFIGDDRDDHVIKLEQIQEYIEVLGFKDFDDANVILFEDNMKTINAFQQRGAICFDANRANKKMRKVA